MPIYTKTGDKGETSLFGGTRVSKSHERVEVYGSVDELNSWVGLIVAKLDHKEKKEFLMKIQSDLFVLGGNLAGWKTDLAPLKTRVTEMEVEIDAMETQLQELKNFILPGGTELSATVHIARSITRRVERQTVRLFEVKSQKSGVNGQEKEVILQYLNRLSDLFFVLARFINKKADVSDVIWSGISKK